MNCCENAYFTEDSSHVLLFSSFISSTGGFSFNFEKSAGGKNKQFQLVLFLQKERDGVGLSHHQTHRLGTLWVQLIMADIRNTANVIQDSSHTSGDKLIYSNVYSEVQQKNSPLELNSREVYTFAGKIQHSPCWEAQSLTWWSFDLFWSFNCTPGVSEQLDIIF